MQAPRVELHQPTNQPTNQSIALEGIMKPINPTPATMDANGATDGTYFVDGYNTVHRLDLKTGYTVGVGALKATDSIPSLTMVGRWTDGSGFSGDAEEAVYWDRVRQYGDLEEALQVARQNGELAIWDNLNNCEVRV